jgi:2-C-methyl-D-erythritol 4-phosphate cytidylyltransferase
MEARFTAILLMAGKGERLDHPLPKQFLPLGGVPLYIHALNRLLACPEFAEVLLVCPPKWVDQVEGETRAPRVRVVAGGETRQASSYQGLLACAPGTDFVVIHDAARPFVSPEILCEHIRLLPHYPALDTCIPATDTMVVSQDGATISSIPLRSTMWHGQTPQSFSHDLLLRAHQSWTGGSASDDCSLVLSLGHPVHIVRGSVDNFKITTTSDLRRAEGVFIYGKT